MHVFLIVYGFFAVIYILFGGDRAFLIAVYNDTPQEITVTVHGVHHVVAPGGSARAMYPGENGGDKGSVSIQVGNCTLTYPIDIEVLKGYPWSSQLHGNMPVQLEADSKLYAIPPGSEKTAALADIKDKQTGPFPISPASRECH